MTRIFEFSSLIPHDGKNSRYENILKAFSFKHVAFGELVKRGFDNDVTLMKFDSWKFSAMPSG